MNWKFELINHIPEAFIAQAETGHVFFQPEMIRSWLNTYAPLQNITPIFVMGSDGANDAFMPLVLWKRNWKNAFVKTIVPVGNSDYDYHNPIFKVKPNQEQLNSFWDSLISFLKSNYNFDTLTLSGITDQYLSSTHNWQRDEICPMLQLHDINNEEELMAFFKTSLRGDIRRQIRRLNEIGQLTYTEYHAWDEIPTNTFAEFMRQHSLRWPQAYKAPKYHENLLKNGLPTEQVHFSTLSVGHTEIAWHLGFTHNRRFYYYMPAGNQEYFKYSPTKIHLFYLMRRAIEQGYDVYDHLRGEENYKSGWSNTEQYVNTLTIERNTPAYTLKKAAIALRHLLHI